jgi:HPt (histidine-containing phosphotransfer) domain-containing protein
MDTPRTAALPDASLAPAVNHAGGIARLMGDAALFARVLARFRNEYRQAASSIRVALEHGDTPLALRLVHTLKGAAGMIEAVPLRRAAHALEQRLREGGDDDQPYGMLERLQDELERVLRELEASAGNLPARPAGVPPAAVSAMSPPGAADQEGVLERLVALLDEGNGDAVDLARDAAPVLAAQLGETAWRMVAEAVEAFDFDGALALLQACAADD